MPCEAMHSLSPRVLRNQVTFQFKKEMFSSEGIKLKWTLIQALDIIFPPFQAQAERNELGWGGLDSRAVWTGPAKGEGAANPSWTAVQGKQAETAAAGQHPYKPWEANCESMNTYTVPHTIYMTNNWNTSISNFVIWYCWLSKFS